MVAGEYLGLEIINAVSSHVVFWIARVLSHESLVLVGVGVVGVQHLGVGRLGLELGRRQTQTYFDFRMLACIVRVQDRAAVVLRQRLLGSVGLIVRILEVDSFFGGEGGLWKSLGLLDHS